MSDDADYSEDFDEVSTSQRIPHNNPSLANNLIIEVLKGFELPSNIKGDAPTSYVHFLFLDGSENTTAHCIGAHQPVYNKKFSFPTLTDDELLASLPESELQFTLIDVTDENESLIGDAFISLAELAKGATIDSEVALVDDEQRAQKTKIHIRLYWEHPLSNKANNLRQNLPEILQQDHRLNKKENATAPAPKKDVEADEELYGDDFDDDDKRELKPSPIAAQIHRKDDQQSALEGHETEKRIIPEVTKVGAAKHDAIKPAEKSPVVVADDDLYGDDFEEGQKSENLSPEKSAASAPDQQHHKDSAVSYAQSMSASNDDNGDKDQRYRDSVLDAGKAKSAPSSSVNGLLKPDTLAEDDDATSKKKEGQDIHTDLQPTPLSGRMRRLSRGSVGMLGDTGRRDSLGSLGGEDWQNFLEEPSNISTFSADDGDNYLLKLAGAEFAAKDDDRAPTEEEHQQTLDKILSDTVQDTNATSLLAIAREKKVDIAHSRPSSATGLPSKDKKEKSKDEADNESDDGLDDFILHMKVESKDERKVQAAATSEQPTDDTSTPTLKPEVQQPMPPSERPAKTVKRSLLRHGSEAEDLAAIDAFLHENASKAIIRSRSNSSSAPTAAASRPSSAASRASSVTKKEKPKHDDDDISDVDNFLKQMSNDSRLRSTSMYANQAEVKAIIQQLSAQSEGKECGTTEESSDGKVVETKTEEEDRLAPQKIDASVVEATIVLGHNAEVDGLLSQSPSREAWPEHKIQSAQELHDISSTAEVAVGVLHGTAHDTKAAANAADDEHEPPATLQRKPSTSAQALREHVQQMRSASVDLSPPDAVEEHHSSAPAVETHMAMASALTSAPTTLAPVVRPASAVFTSKSKLKKETSADNVMDQIRRQTEERKKAADNANSKKVTIADPGPTRKEGLPKVATIRRQASAPIASSAAAQAQEIPRKPPVPRRPMTSVPIRQSSALGTDKEVAEKDKTYRKEFFVRNPSSRTLGEDDAAHHKTPLNISPEMQDTVILLKMLRKKATEAKAIVKEADAKWRAKLTDSLNEAIAELKGRQDNEARLAGLDIKVVTSQLKSLELSAVPMPAPLIITAQKPVSDKVIAEHQKQVELAESFEHQKKKLERRDIQLRNKLSRIHKRHQEECERLSQTLNEPIHRLDLVQDGLMKEIKNNVDAAESAVEHAARVQEVIPENTQDIILRKRRAGVVAKAYSALRNSFRSLADQCAAIPEVYSHIDLHPEPAGGRAPVEGGEANRGVSASLRKSRPTSAMEPGAAPNVVRALSAQRLCAKSVENLRVIVNCPDPYDNRHRSLYPTRPQSSSLAKAILQSAGVPFTGYKDINDPASAAAPGRRKKARRKKRRSKAASRAKKENTGGAITEGEEEEDEVEADVGDGGEYETGDTDLEDRVDGYGSETRKESAAQLEDTQLQLDADDTKSKHSRLAASRAASSAGYDDDFESEDAYGKDDIDGGGGEELRGANENEVSKNAATTAPNEADAAGIGGKRSSSAKKDAGDDDDEYGEYFEEDSGEESVDVDHFDTGDQGTMIKDRRGGKKNTKRASTGSTGTRKGSSRERDDRLMSGPFEKDHFFQDTRNFGERPSSRIRARLVDPFYATGVRPHTSEGSRRHRRKSTGDGKSDDEDSWNPIPCFCCGRKYRGKGKLIPNNNALDRTLMKEFKEKQEAYVENALRSGAVSFKQRTLLEDRAFFRARYGHDQPEQKIFCTWECMKDFVALCLPPQQKYYMGILIDLAAGYVVESKTVYTQGDTGIGRLT